MKLDNGYRKSGISYIEFSSFEEYYNWRTLPICVGDEDTEVIPEIEVLPDEETEREIKTLPADDPWEIDYPYPKHYPQPTPKGFNIGVRSFHIFYYIYNKEIDMKTKKFIERAQKIHGNKYNYSLTVYKNAHSKVKIICFIHGEFLQSANSHIRGSGCPICANEKKGLTQKLSTNEFIKRAQKIHGNKYDYSLVNYINNKIKVKIVCNLHGVFIQSPEKHLSGQGCRECFINFFKNCLRSNTEEFIAKAKKVHGNKYDYSLVNYINNRTKIKIICPIHGIWEQKPNGHLNGKGCRKCSGAQKLTTDIFISRAKEAHDNKYDYSLLVIKDNNLR